MKKHSSYKDLSIIDYLRSKGFKVEQRGRKYFTHSPYRKERTPSFCIHEDNAWTDYGCDGSGPKAGNIITLAKFFGDDLSKLDKVTPVWVAPPPVVKKPFNNEIPSYYTDITQEELVQVQEYAAKRSIHTHYLPGVVSQKNGSTLHRFLSLVFPHQSADGIITGAKFRFINPIDSQRFTSRGVLGFYVLKNIIENHYSEPTLYLVESETSANSLWEYFKSISHNAVVVSCGGVNNIPDKLPFNYKGKLIIDYDGSEAKFTERVAKYAKFHLDPVRLILPKGEDINSLCQHNKVNLIENLI